MRVNFLLRILIILLCCAACQATEVTPTIDSRPTQSILAARTARPTQTLRPIATRTRLTESTAMPTLPASPSPRPIGNLLTVEEAPPQDTLAPELIAAVELWATATLSPDTVMVGRSVEGRAIVARQLGSGSRALVLVGGIHGGWESNTVTLINELITYFDSHPREIPPEITLYLIPAANPDGLLRGRTEEGRFNTNGVDLNRNWGCEWSADAVWRRQAVNPGAAPFSEPETQGISAFIQRLMPEVVLFYHSAAGGVFAGNCEGDHGSNVMAAVLGEATGYNYGESFTAYRVTGTAATWVDGLGIPSADVELQSWRESEFDRNLNGIKAVMTWLIQRGIP